MDKLQEALFDLLIEEAVDAAMNYCYHLAPCPCDKPRRILAHS